MHIEGRSVIKVEHLTGDCNFNFPAPCTNKKCRVLIISVH